MIKARKLVALMLAFLMIFSSASVFASAMSDNVDSGTALNISTKFFKEVDGVWTETTKVQPNDTVKARVYLGTDYYSGDSTLLFFYDKDFFTHSYAASGQINLTMNDAANGIAGYFVTNANLQSQVDAGYITADQLNDYGVFVANLAIENGETAKFDNSDWLFEFELKVASDASGEGDLFTVEELYQSTSRTKALGDVPKGVEGGVGADAWPMWVWDAAFNFESQPVSTISSITFKANGGAFADGSDTFGPISGTIEETIAADALPANPNYEGYTFLGWVDAEIADPTESDIIATPTQYPEDDTVLNAYWVKNVNITFANTGDSTIDPITNVTPNTEFKEIANPTKAGYTFVGWDVRGNMDLPDVYPSVDTTYTAVWALNVEITFEMNGADPVAPLTGYEGAETGAFEKVEDPADKTDDPVKEGHYFVGWLVDGVYSQSLPTVFPEKDIVAEAIFDTYTYYVTYIVKNEKTGESSTYFLQAEYGSEIKFPRVQVPAGYTMDTQWYTDADCTTPLPAGATMGTAPITLYTTMDVTPYKAYFMLNEGDDIADAYAVVDVVYGEEIAVPDDPTKSGYTFAGWDTFPSIMDKEEDVYFYATWEEKVGNVVYYLNDGTDTIYEVYDIPYNYDLEIPGDPSREGYTFLGWNTDAAATAPLAIEGTKMPELAEGVDKIEYYAVWQVNKYNVTFDSNGGSDVEDKEQDYNSEVTAPTEPTRAGYKFLGWKNADNETVTFPFSMPAYDVALTAEWKQEVYTIRYADTGDVTIAEKTVKMGDTIEIPTGLTKDGQGVYFTGWDETPPTAIGDMGNDGDVFTYTAQWAAESYTIIYKDTGDTTIANKTVKMGDTIEIPTGLTKDGQGVYFSGWDVTPPTAIGDMGNNGDEFTYTAQWANETYTLKFANTGDTVIADKNVTYGDTIEATAAPEKAGYVFAGWDVTPPTAIGDLGDNGEVITYTASWTAKTFVFHFTNTGDTTVADATVTFGDEYTAPTGLTKTGYNFVGWEDKDGNAPPATIGDMGEDKAEFTYAAQWEAKKINVTFNGNTGLIGGKAEVQVESTFDDAIVLPEDEMTKDGYAFVGWSTDPDAETGSMTLGDLTTETPATYYAIWSASAANYTVEFYYMNVDGTDYVKADDETDTLPGVVDQPVPTYIPAEVTGFAYNAGISTVDGTVPATGTLVLKVYYDRQKFNLTYEGNDAVQVYYQAAIPSAVKTPEKVGHYFNGWVGVPATMPADDVVIAADWAKESYVFNFADTGDMTIDPETVTFGETFTAPTGLTKTGYVFTGFEPAVPTTIEDMGDNGDEFTYTAQWREKTYTFTFTNLYGNDVEDATVKYGEKYTAPTGLVREGWTFNGWEDEFGVAPPTAIEDMGEDGTVFTYSAKWLINTNNVIFDKDNGEATETKPVKYSVQVAEPAAPSKTGYDFSHWIDIADGSTVTFPFSMPDRDVSLKAIYTPKTYVLKFADTGDQTIADMNVKFGDTVTAPTGLTKNGTGYYFTGWDVTPPTTIGDMGATGTEFTYTAQWTKESYTLTFADTGDNAVEDMSVTYGQTITVPSGLTKNGQGLYFTGFAPELTATIGDLGDNGDTINYTAQWAKESYTLTFTNLFGNTVADMPVTYGDTITVPAGLTRTGYNFTGWSPALEATIGDLGNNGETLSYAAQWTAKVIGVTFDGNEGTIEGAAQKVVDTTFDQAIVAPKADRAGYTFVGWSTNKDDTTGVTNLGNLTTETPATYYAIWSADAKTYTVEFYEMNVDGKDYTKLEKVDTLNGTVGKETATYVPEVPVGFEVNATKSVLKGTVPAEGELVLVVYYDRQQFNLTYEGNSAVKVYYGTAAADMPEAAAEPTKEGHVFASWAQLPATMPATDVSIAANWDKETYTLKFADTDDNGTVITKPVTFGDDFTAPSGLVKTGHVFAGWDTTPPTKIGDLGENNTTITYTAQWTKETYTLTFTNLFGNTVADMPVTYGDTITVPAGLTRTGYNFTGWSPALEATIGDLGEDKATLSYEAQWTAKVIGVTFDGNKGTIEGATQKVVDTTFDQAIVAPQADRAGYTFLGWSTDKDAEVGSNNLGNLTTETPATYYAIWSADGANYTVEFYEEDLDGNYVKTGEDTTLSGLVDETVKYTPAEKTGFKVNNEMSELEGTIPAEETLVLKVYYDRQSYVLSYMGAGSEHKAFDVLYGTPVAQWPVPDTDPTRTGYYFTKWAASGKTEMPAEKVTVSSEWAKETYTITFDTVGGSTVADITAKYGEGIIVPDDPTKEGHVFAGWSDVIPDVMPDYGDNNEVITITASWTAETYTLKFADTDDNGTVITKPVTFGDTIEVPSGLTKTGHVFAGWDVTPPTKIGDLGEDKAVITYTAQWTKETYTLKFANTGDTAIADKNVTFGDTIAATSDPEWAGHVFAGWDVTPPTAIGDLGEDKAVITYTASWTVETYTFTFTNTGDTAVDDAPVTFGEAYTAPTGLTKTGYNFVGWEDKDGNAPPATIGDMGEDKAVIEYAAKWEAKTIEVTFNANGGTIGGEAEVKVASTFDGAIKLPEGEMYKAGYAFVGWSTDPDAETGSMSLGDLTTETPATYYAIWSATSANYIVEFYYMDVEGAGYELAEDETLTLPGVVDSEVEYIAEKTKTGFVLNEDDSILDGTVPATGTLVLEVYYDRNEYEVTYEGNDPVKVYYQAVIPAAAKTPAKVGHYFNGWVDVPATMPADNVAIAADWQKETYTLTFTELYGNVVEDINVTYGDTIEVPAGLVREGYVFGGWSPELTETIGDLGDNKATVVYKAQWSLDQFTITIKLDGGNIDGETADVVITQDYGTKVEFASKPVKEGNTFVDWSVTIPATMPAEDMTITAIWQINTYTIKFNTDGGTDTADITAQYGTSITAPADPTKEGHVFAGWSEEIPETMPDYGANGASHEIKATWTKESYVLKFADTGDTAIADKTVSYGDTIEAITGLTKVGHVFAGWDVTPPTTIGDLGKDGEVITYTAKWTPETYTLVFADTNDAGDEITMNVTFGDTIVVPTGLTKTGHTFAGWDVTPPTAIGDLGENEATLTYTAQWDKITYTVKWTDESGTKTTQVVYGDAIVAPDAAAKEGYYFVKWTPDVPATMPADENLEFTALYEVSVYNVNFYVNGAFKTGYTAEYGEVIRIENIGYTVPTGYIFDGWYTDAACTVKFVEGTTVGAEVINLYGKETVGSFKANFYLDDAKTELYDSFDVVFDKQIIAPADPTRDGYEFAGWDPFVGLMDAEGKDFVAQWNEKSNIAVTFYADMDNDGVAEEYETIDGLIYGEEMELPGDPYKKGYRFDGWVPEGAEVVPENVVNLEGTTVPANDAKYYACFTITEFTVNYYVYEESEHGPEGTPAPGFIVYADAEGNAITGSYNLGDAIAHPAAPEIEYYNFVAWVDADGNVWAEGAEMPAEEVTLYAKYERVAVRLVAKDGSTTIVTEGTDTTNYYDWTISGFTGSRLNLNYNTLNSKFVKVEGDGYFTVKPAEGNTRYGTGACVEVFDNVTGEKVQTFFLVYYGDINGDCNINYLDDTALLAEISSPSWSKRGSQIKYMMKAADLDGNGRVNTIDVASLKSVLAGDKIDQTTGKVI